MVYFLIDFFPKTLYSYRLLFGSATRLGFELPVARLRTWGFIELTCVCVTRQLTEEPVDLGWGKINICVSRARNCEIY